MGRGTKDFKEYSAASYFHDRPWQKCLLLFTDAGRAFDEIKYERTMLPSFGFLFVVLLVVHVATMLIQAFAYAGSGFSELFPEIFGTGVLVTFLAAVMFPFVITLIVHPFVIAFGGKGILQTFKIITYVLVPYVVFNMVPFVGNLFMMVSLFMLGYGIHRIHNLSQFKSGLAVAIPFIVCYVAVIIFGWQIALNFGV